MIQVFIEKCFQTDLRFAAVLSQFKLFIGLTLLHKQLHFLSQHQKVAEIGNLRIKVATFLLRFVCIVTTQF